MNAEPNKQPPSSQPPCSQDVWKLRPAFDNEIGPDLEFVLPEGGPLLEPNGNYAACFITRTAWSCSPFTVQIPYFEYPDDAKAISRMKPWVLKKADDGLPVAIFGVVGAGLMQSVGRLNYTWTGAKLKGGEWRPDDSYEMVVQAALPGETLKQILRYCLQDAACGGAHKVLLAQMSEQDAYGIVGQLQALKGLPALAGIELIVAAADANRASGDRTVTRFRNGASHDFNQPIVLVPGEHVPSPDPYLVQVRLQRAVVSPELHPGQRIVSNKVFAGPPETRFRVNLVPTQTGTTLDLLDRFLSRPEIVQGTGLAAGSDEEVSASLERIALKTMQDACHSDAAILQHHDVFFSNMGRFLRDPVEDVWARAMIDAIFWKGDLIECIQVTGDTIKSLLQQSQQFQDQEDNGIDTGFSKGWALATIGLDQSQQDPSRRIIGGNYLDPKKLYGIAITDYLANGDTGYADFLKAPPLPTDTWSGTDYWVLADAVKHEIFPHADYGPYSAPDLLDNTKQPVPDRKIQPGLKRWVTSLSSDLENDRGAAQPLDPGIEKTTENRGVWSIDLYKADASFSLFIHNGNESQLGQRFPGVTAVDLSSPNLETAIFDYSLRVERSGPRWWGFYIEDDLNYGHKANRTPQNIYQRSETADYYNHEVGLAPNLWPGHRNPSTLKALLPFAIRSQLWPPITQITPGADTTGAKAVASQAPISNTFSFRPGLRFDYVYPKPDSLTSAAAAPGQLKPQPGQIQTGSLWTSYIEAGYEIGELVNGPSAYIFHGTPSKAAAAQGAVPVNQECFVADPSFINCVLGTPADTSNYGSYTASVLGQRDHKQSGFYLDFRLDVPLPRLPQLEFVVENRGDFLVFGEPHDTPVDTRLFNDIKATLIFPIPSLRKLSLAPTFEWIVFRNRLLDNTYFGINAFVSLSYSFDWRQGLEWKKVLGFSNPTPPLSTLPTR